MPGVLSKKGKKEIYGNHSLVISEYPKNHPEKPEYSGYSGRDSTGFLNTPDFPDCLNIFPDFPDIWEIKWGDYESFAGIVILNIIMIVISNIIMIVITIETASSEALLGGVLSPCSLHIFTLCSLLPCILSSLLPFNFFSAPL